MSWQQRAGAGVQRAFLAAAPRPWPWTRGMWATARPDYGSRPLPEQARIEVVEAAGASRRVARFAGVGRPLLIVPGLYATLDEGLFADLALLATRTGRPVVLLEDRLAGPTLALNGAEVPGLARQGAELAAVAAPLGEPPDVLALSAGVAIALFAPAEALHRLVGWSSVVDTGETARRVTGHLVLRPYYARVHARAFRSACLPPLEDLWERLTSDPVPPPALPALLVHAPDDPVAPAAAVEALVEHCEVCLLPGGGHLGFGSVAGNAVYLLPFAEDP